MVRLGPILTHRLHITLAILQMRVILAHLIIGWNGVGSADNAISGSTHGAFANSKLVCGGGSFKSARQVTARRCIIILAVVELRHKLAHILSTWGTGEERLGQGLWDLPAVVQKLV